MDIAYCLLSLGAVAPHRGDAARAAMLLARSEAMLVEEDAVFDPAEVGLFESATKTVRRALGDAFESNWQMGRALSTRDAIALALGREGQRPRE
jgi:hypothetical protein